MHETGSPPPLSFQSDLSRQPPGAVNQPSLGLTPPSLSYDSQSPHSRHPPGPFQPPSSTSSLPMPPSLNGYPGYPPGAVPGHPAGPHGPNSGSSMPMSSHMMSSPSMQTPPMLPLPGPYLGGGHMDGYPGQPGGIGTQSVTIPGDFYNSSQGPGYMQGIPPGYGMQPPHYPSAMPYGGGGFPLPFPVPQSPAFNPNTAPPMGTTPGTPNAPGSGYHAGMPPRPFYPGAPPSGMPMGPPGHPMMSGYPGQGPPPPGANFPPRPPQGTPTQSSHLHSPLSHHQSIVGHLPSPYNPFSQTTGTDGRGRIVHQEIKLEISAKGLWDRDLTSKSDPTCVVFLEKRTHAMYGAGPYSHMYETAAGEEFTSGDAQSTAVEPMINWVEAGRTECIKNCLNPHFRVHVTVPYHFEKLQHIRLGLWDIDSKKTEDLKTHDFLGDVRTTVAELVMKRVWTAPLTSRNTKHTHKKFSGMKRDLGTITVIVHEGRDGGTMLVKAAMCGKKLDKKDFFLTSDPYVIVTQLGKSNSSSRSQLYKSEVIRRNTNPVWRPFQFKVAIPKGGGKSDIILEFLVYDKDNHRRDDEIGKAVHSVQELEKAQPVPLINEKKKRKRRSYRNSGMLDFNKFQVISMPSFVDYLQGGLKLHFSVAVDLTASNGSPTEPLSLHYFHPYYGNRYTKALTAIANVLRVYCPSDNLFAAFGFGAELPGNPGYTSSCFPLGLGPDPMCNGIEGILHAYASALHAVRLSGPTNFAPLIETVSRTASQRLNTQNDQNYDVLLILTDGVVSDYDLTVDRIISASHTAPLSVIIIGIGNRNFKKMKELDSDDKLLTSGDGTRQAARDICQFVDFGEYEHAPPEQLGAAVLAELPGNIVEYFVGVCDPPIDPGRRQAMLPFS